MYEPMVESGAGPGTEVRGGAILFEAGGMGAALRPPLGPGRSLGGGQGAKLLEVRNFIRPKHVSQEVNLLHFCLYKWSKIYKNGSKLKTFGLK
jgi:hypothetical protein